MTIRTNVFEIAIAVTLILGLVGLIYAFICWIREKRTGIWMDAKLAAVSIFCFLGIEIVFVLGALKIRGFFPTMFFFPWLIVGLVTGIASICTKEEPKCFRYLGLALNLLPVLLFFILWACLSFGGF